MEETGSIDDAALAAMADAAEADPKESKCPRHRSTTTGKQASFQAFWMSMLYTTDVLYRGSGDAASARNVGHVQVGTRPNLQYKQDGTKGGSSMTYNLGWLTSPSMGASTRFKILHACEEPRGDLQAVRHAH